MIEIKKYFTKEKKDVGAYVISHFLSGLLPLLALPLLVRSVGLKGMGQWSIFFVFIAFYRPLSGWSLTSRFFRNYYLYSEKESQEEISRIVILDSVLLAVLTLITSFLLYRDEVLGVSTHCFLLIPLIVYFNNITELMLRSLRMNGKSVNAAFYEVVTNAVNISLTVLFAVYYEYGWMSFVYSRLITNCAAFAASVFWLGRNYRIKFTTDLKNVRLTLNEGTPIGIHLIGGILIGMTDRIVLKQMFSLEAVGIYSIGCMIAGGMSTFTAAVNKVWGPWVLKQLSIQNPDRKRLIAEKTHLLALALVAVALCVAVIGKLYVNYFMSAEIQMSEFVMYWALIAFLLQGFYQIITHHVLFQGRTKIFMKITFAVGILNLILTIIFARYFGVMGAIQATALSFGIEFLCFLIYIQKNCSLPKLFFLRSAQ